MKRILFIIMAFVAALNATAQSADKLYSEGKAFYDAKNYAAALPPLKAAAEKGHRKAQYRLGRCYDKGHGTKENDKLAFEWYLKAAAQDYADEGLLLPDLLENVAGGSADGFHPVVHTHQK